MKCGAFVGWKALERADSTEALPEVGIQWREV
jgi:hypothetical protein